jgi:ceramide glucosyltransferase
VFLKWILGGLAFASLLSTVSQWLVARRFPLHRRVTEKSFAPAVTLLKPLKGLEPETASCLRSWLVQEYGGAVQVLFGVATEDDPVCEVVRELMAAHPQVDAQLVICVESLGANAKVSTLIQLQRLAKHGVVMVSDADVRVPSDFLWNAVAPLRDEKVGASFCFYCLANPANLAMRWEAVAINADFWSMVLLGHSMNPVKYLLGAVMTARRACLDEIGGFTALADYLADDFQLGNQIAGRGHRIGICPVVAECWDRKMGWAEVWAHQLRWSRTIRVCMPCPYFASIISNATLWPLLWLLASPVKPVALAAIGCWVVRMGTGLWLQYRMTGSKSHVWYDWLILFKDLMQGAVWAGAFVGNKVDWRGRSYRVERGGKLAKI